MNLYYQIIRSYLYPPINVYKNHCEFFHRLKSRDKVCRRCVMLMNYESDLNKMVGGANGFGNWSKT